MDKFSLNDWLTLQTRKDISLLRRSLKHEPIRIAILIDVGIAVVSTCLDNIYSSKDNASNSPSVLWWIIVAATLLVTIGGIYLSIRFEKKKVLDRKVSPPIAELVDLFDNEVCYNIMTADSMDDHLILDEKTGKIKSDDEVQKFYFIEACYYLNKAIGQLFRFKVLGKEAIFREEIGSGISMMRFKNVCSIIQSNYQHLNNITGEKLPYKNIIKQNQAAVDMFDGLIHSLIKDAGFIELEGCKIGMSEEKNNSFSPSIALMQADSSARQ